MMISLEQHIEYLMAHHDCVVVPGWGALIANYQPAEVRQGVILPPSRYIAFNSDVSHNDGMLATSLMRRHNLSFNQACDFVNDTVASYKRHIATGSELAFGHLGFFKLGEKQKLEFAPLASAEVCDENFGLTNVRIAPLESQENHSAAIIAPVTITLRERLKVAASIAAIVGVGMLLSTPVILDRATQTASLNVVEVKKSVSPKIIVTPKVTVTPAAKSTAADKSFTFIDNKGKETPLQPTKNGTPKDKDEPAQKEAKGSKSYSLVIATCRSQHKAEKMAKKFTSKGTEVEIVETSENEFNLVIAQSKKKHDLLKIKKSLPAELKAAHIVKN